MADGKTARQHGVANFGANNNARKLQPRRYQVNERCSRRCSVGEFMLGPELFEKIHSLYEMGYNDEEISHASDELNHHLSYGALGRHRGKHLVPVSAKDVALEAPDKVDHIEVLERIIAMGAQRLNPAKIGPETVLKAMDMHFRQTQGKAQDEMMSAIAAAMSGAGAPQVEEEAGESNREAIKTPDERVEELAAVE